MKLNLKKLSDLGRNLKFRGGLLEIKLKQLVWLKMEVSTADEF